jgi:hypothetical protein
VCADLTSHEILSFEALTRRLSEVRRGEEHLKRNLPLASEHNRILRLNDICAYTGIPYPWIRRQFPDMYRMEFPDAPKPAPSGRDKPATKHEIEERQRELSRFFYGWDRGTLVKARVRDEWKIVGRYQDAVPLGAAARPERPPGKILEMRIDLETFALRFNMIVGVCLLLWLLQFVGGGRGLIWR